MSSAREVPSLTRWLTQEEMAAWLPLLRVVQLLPQAMDRQLRKDAGVRHAYYQVVVHLSAQPDRTLSMGELARLAATSPSRLSHAVAAMEERGWVTDVRRLVFDRLTENEVSQLRSLTLKLLPSLDA